MKMKKMIYFMFALLIMSATSMKAQVAIGNDPALEPRPGTILDLRHVSGNNMGLLLPKVTLTDVKIWAPVVGTKADEVDGMMVYNDSPSTANDLDGKGVYIWVNGSWNKMGSSLAVGSAPEPPVAINASTTNPCKGATGMTYSVDDVDNATSYTWEAPTGWTITAGDGTKSITVTVSSSAVDGNISVTADNSYGSSAAKTIAVTVNDVPAQPGAITGPTTVTAGTTGLTYNVPLTSDATSYTWSVPPTGWTITSGSTSRSIIVTAGVNAVFGNISVTAHNACGSSTTARTIAVTVTPPCEGAIIKNGAYSGPVTEQYVTGLEGDFVAGWTTSDFTPLNLDLCWNKSNVSGTNRWSDAIAKCIGTWRLPNLKELQVLYEAFGGTGETANDFTYLHEPNSNPAGATNLEPSNYWSSTESSTTRAYTFNFGSSNWGRLNEVNKTSYVYVRCVRTL